MVESSGGGDGEIVSTRPVPLRVNPVQGKGQNRQNVSINGRLWPGGIYFTGGHIFDVIPVAYSVVSGVTVVWSAVMDDDKFRNNYGWQNDFAGEYGFFYFCFRNLWRIGAIQGVVGNSKLLHGVRQSGRTWKKLSLLLSSNSGKNFGTGNADWFVAGSGNIQNIFAVRTNIGRLLAESIGRCRKVYERSETSRIRTKDLYGT